MLPVGVGGSATSGSLETGGKEKNSLVGENPTGSDNSYTFSYGIFLLLFRNIHEVWSLLCCGNKREDNTLRRAKHDGGRKSEQRMAVPSGTPMSQEATVSNKVEIDL